MNTAVSATGISEPVSWHSERPDTLELQARAPFVPLERQVDEPLEQLAVADPRCGEELRVHARLR